MEEKTMQVAFDYLDKLGAKMGLTAQQIWPWFIRQQYIEAIISSIVLVLLTSTFFFLIRFAYNHWEPKTGYSIDELNHEPFWIISGFCIGFSMIVAHIYFWTEFPDIFNVEYAALKDILRSLI